MLRHGIYTTTTNGQTWTAFNWSNPANVPSGCEWPTVVSEVTQFCAQVCRRECRLIIGAELGYQPVALSTRPECRKTMMIGRSQDRYATSPHHCLSNNFVQQHVRNNGKQPRKPGTGKPVVNVNRTLSTKHWSASTWKATLFWWAEVLEERRRCKFENNNTGFHTAHQSHSIVRSISAQHCAHKKYAQNIQTREWRRTNSQIWFLWMNALVLIIRICVRLKTAAYCFRLLLKIFHSFLFSSTFFVSLWALNNA